MEVREWEEGFWQLSEEELQGARNHVDVLPAPIVQVQALICGEEGAGVGVGIERQSAPACAFSPQGKDWGRTSP